MDSLRILVADDHPVFRHGLRTLLGETADLVVVGEATTGEEAVALAEQLQPDLVLMDLRMPGSSGIEATRRILHASPHIRVLVLTMFEDDASVFTALRAGARGYVLKDADKDDLLRAIRAVAHGEAIFSPGIASRIVEYFATTRPAAPKEAFPSLSERERELLHLLAPGPDQCPDRRSPVAEPQDRLQLRLNHPQQTAGGRPRRGHPPRPRSRAGRLTLQAVAQPSPGCQARPAPGHAAPSSRPGRRHRGPERGRYRANAS